MSSRASYRGNGGVVPAGISFTTSSTSAGALPSDHPLQAYSSSVAKPLPYPPSQAGLSTSHQAYGAASPVVTILPTASSSTRPAAGDVSSASNSAGDGGQRGYPTPAAAAAANTRADPPHVNGQQSYRSYDAPAAHRSDGAAVEAGDYEKDGGNEDEEEVDEEADYVDDDAAAAMDAEGEQAANGGQPLEYCGVRLLPGVEQLDFDEGYYVGTIDENGEMAGYGKATWHTGDTYEGEWLEGMMHGKGTYTWADGDYYHGDYVRGQMEGYGEMKDTTGLYVGEWAGDMRQGYGRMVYAGGNIYEGEWLAGMCHGTGKLIEVAANVTYEGEFNRNEKEGRGVQTNAEGDVYEGEFAKGKPNGRGTYLWSDGSRYIGMFKDGVKHGDGCEWLANGDWIAGLFQNGEHVDDNSTRHKAVQLSDDDESERGSGTDYDAEDDEDDDETAFDAHGNPIPSRRIMTKGLSDAAAAAVMAPLDPEQLRRITEPVRRPSVSISIPHRGSTVNGGAGTAGGGGRGTIRAANGETASATEAATPLTLALNAPQIMLDDSELEGWTSLKTIGKGSFGAVYTALLRNGRTVCCKVIELGNVENEEEMEKLRNEIALMKRLHHPNCVQYYGSLEDKTKNTLNIFMEYVSGGTLTSFVNKFNSIPLNTLRQWAYQMVTGVKYLHERGIVHRDIKGDNVLVSVDGIVKLADFGCSKSIDDVCSATHGCSTMVGTPYWMAPEVIKCEAGGYGMKSDIWSLGCTIVEMLTGKPPWPECNSMWAAVYKIANSTGLPTEIPSDVDPELMDLLEKCFERNPKLRPTAAELLKHPFLAKAAEKVSSPTASSVKGRD